MSPGEDLVWQIPGGVSKDFVPDSGRAGVMGDY